MAVGRMKPQFCPILAESAQRSFWSLSRVSSPSLDVECRETDGRKRFS